MEICFLVCQCGGHSPFAKYQINVMWNHRIYATPCFLQSFLPLTLTLLHQVSRLSRTPALLVRWTELWGNLCSWHWTPHQTLISERLSGLGSPHLREGRFWCPGNLMALVLIGMTLKTSRTDSTWRSWLSWWSRTSLWKWVGCTQQKSNSSQDNLKWRPFDSVYMVRCGSLSNPASQQPPF